VAERPSSSSNWGGPRAALAAILAGAAALRLAGIGHGGVLAADHDPVGRAWKLVHGGGADPHRYPSLLAYALAPLQWWHDAPSYESARVVVALLGVAAVAAAWWLGSRAYGTLAGGVAAAATAVATTHVALSHTALPDVPFTLGVAAALALLVSGRLELGALAAGLATGFEWSGLILAVPVAVVAGRRRWRLAAALVLLVAGFLASSPFAAVHPGAAAGDLADGVRFLRSAHGDRAWAGLAFAHVLWRGLGPAFAVALVGLVYALAQRRRPDLVLASFVLAYSLALLPVEAHLARYTLPLVPPLAALAGRMRALAPVTLLLLVVPLAWSIRDDARLRRSERPAAAFQAVSMPSTIWSRDETRGPLRAAPALPARGADRLRRGRDDERAREREGEGIVPARVARRLAGAREQDPRARLLPRLAPRPVDGGDQRPLEQHRRGRRS
jgi:hypothetical protein